MRTGGVLICLILCFLLLCTCEAVSVSHIAPLSVTENAPIGRVLHTIEVTDGEDESSRFLFSLTGTDLLHVDKSSGVISVNKPIDREEVEEIRFDVKVRHALSHFPVSGDIDTAVTVPVTVTVTDVNDNPPRFFQEVYNVYVREDISAGTSVISNITATDADSTGDRLEASCDQQHSTPGACEIFGEASLTPPTSRLYNGSLQLIGDLNSVWSDQDRLVVSLQVTDGVHTTHCTVRVHVLDVQNRAPTILGSTAALISEKAPVGALVTKISARDGDTVHPHNITFKLLDNPGGYFQIDPDSGQVTLAKAIDRESAPLTDQYSLNFSVKAIETSETGALLRGPMSETVHVVTVTVEDEDDEPPRFNSQNYTVYIPENIADGTPLPGLHISVTDPDLGSGGEFSVRVRDSDDERFSVSPRSGRGAASLTVRLQRAGLDYEQPEHRQIQLQLVAEGVGSNPHLSSVASITVFITDVNDNRPRFSQNTYVAQVSETSSPGTIITTVTATDEDSDEFGTDGFIYRLTGHGAEKFSIDELSGTVTVALCDSPGTLPCIDHESQEHFYLTVEVGDSYGRGHVTRVPLRISSLDANDNPPVISHSVYRTVIREGNTEFDPPLIIQAVDADVTSQLTYSLMDGGVFVIDPKSGRVTVNDSAGLDISSVGSTHTKLVAQVTDGKFSTSVPVDVTIVDTNNNPPRFVKSSYSTVLPESVPVGTIVERVHAIDSDSGDNARITYRIASGAREDFSIGADSGLLTVSAPLQYHKHAGYQLVVHATDSGSPALTGLTTVSVTILDTNDMKPRFSPRTQYAEVSEDTAVGTVFHQMQASDPDVASIDLLKFKLAEVISAVDSDGNRVEPTLAASTFRSVFNMSESGAVLVAGPLPRDIAASVTLRIRVTDTSSAPPQSTFGRLLVTIIDVNESAPRFAPPWSSRRPLLTGYRLREELQIGTVFAQVHASDNGTPVQRFTVSHNPYIGIHSATGKLYVSSRVDYESVQEIAVNVTAFDSGVPRRNSTAQLLIDVTNVNDEAPVFNQELYYANVTEHSDSGSDSGASATFVTRVYADDADIGEFGNVSFIIANLDNSGADLFQIDEHGVIRVTSGSQPSGHHLDRECVSEISLTVVAHDMGPLNFRHTSTAQVKVTVLDVNDEPPVFSKHHYNVSLVEDIPLAPPSPILQVRAVDRDERGSDHVVYSLLPGQYSAWFRIESHSGLIYPVKPISASVPEMLFGVVASDGVHRDSATVSVHVLTANRQKPSFITPYRDNIEYHVTENEVGVGDVILTVEAVDSDPGQSGNVTYHFRENAKNVLTTDQFSIDPISGQIRALVTFDRETKEKYQLLIVARDGGIPVPRESLRYLLISVRDLNDNVPRFEQRLYRFSLMENRPPGINIGSVSAVDPDSGPAGVVLYFALGVSNSSLTVTKVGNVLSRATMDREANQQYRFFVKATNNASFSVEDYVVKVGDPSVSEVLVNVLDENDSPPLFTHQQYYAGVSETAGFGDLVLQVTASDADYGANANVTYTVRSSNIFRPGASVSSGSILPSPFTIDNAGRVRCAAVMSEFDQHRFQLHVISREVEPPHRHDTTLINVWVYDYSQLIHLVLAETVQSVHADRRRIEDALSNVTSARVVIDIIRESVDTSSSPSLRSRPGWSDVYIHVVNMTNHMIVRPNVVIQLLDANSAVLYTDYDFINLQQAQLAQWPVSSFDRHYGGVLAEAGGDASIKAFPSNSTLSSTLIVLIVLLVVLGLGVLTFCVCCCCVRNSVSLSTGDTYRQKKKHIASPAAGVALSTVSGGMAPSYTAHSLSRQRVMSSMTSSGRVDDVDTPTTATENPLWMDRKLKNYEEQELCMNVAEMSGTVPILPHSTSSSPSSALSVAATVSADDGGTAAYATIQSTRPHSQPPVHGVSAPSAIATTPGSRLSIARDGQPELIADLH